MRDFELYAKDQFPLRDSFRSLKAMTRYYLLRQKENNDIYIADGYAAKIEYPLNGKAIKQATDKFREIYDDYMRGTDDNVYYSVIPDKNYFMADKHGYPVMDYDRLVDLMRQGMDFADYIDIFPALSLDDYYRTDLHWKQENLGPVVDRLGEAMGRADQLSDRYTETVHDKPFNGVYAGQSALPLESDRIVCLQNDATAASTVHRLDNDTSAPVYQLDKLTGRDPYDVYLGGALPVLTIENPLARTDRELVIFRDSFGSSLAPLLLEGYAKITLIDIRYMNSSLIGDFVTFTDQDVLFFYNTIILNASVMFK